METFSISRNSSSLIILTRPSTRYKPIFLPQRHTFNPIRCTTTDNNNNKTSSSSSSSNTTNDDANSVQVQATTATPTNPVEISFRRRSRRQAKRLREKENSGMQKARVETPPKKWEDMSLSEKAVELYVGEKGALFWLNKFAYASIFIMIGGWIAFRFVGPAFNLYQLDGPLLSPSDVFK